MKTITPRNFSLFPIHRQRGINLSAPGKITRQAKVGLIQTNKARREASGVQRVSNFWSQPPGACCKRCNNRKGNASPKEAGMKLVKRPQSFSKRVNRQIMRYLGGADAAWRKYLYY